MVPVLTRAGLGLAAVICGQFLAPSRPLAVREPVRVESDADRAVVASFVKHAEDCVRRFTPQSVAKIEQPEDICWVWSGYARLPLTAFLLTGDTAHLDRFLTAIDALSTRLRKGPDGYLGFRGLPLPPFRPQDGPRPRSTSTSPSSKSRGSYAIMSRRSAPNLRSPRATATRQPSICAWQKSTSQARSGKLAGSTSISAPRARSSACRPSAATAAITSPTLTTNSRRCAARTWRSIASRATTTISAKPLSWARASSALWCSTAADIAGTIGTRPATGIASRAARMRGNTGSARSIAAATTRSRSPWPTPCTTTASSSTAPTWSGS